MAGTAKFFIASSTAETGLTEHGSENGQASPIDLEFFNNEEKFGKFLLWQLLFHILQIQHGVLDRLVLAALPFFRHCSFFDDFTLDFEMS